MQKLIEEIKSIGAAKIILAIGIIASLSVVHSAGFLLELPREILLNLPTELIISLNATFIFYVVISFAFARVATIIFSPILIWCAAFLLFIKNICFDTLHYKKLSRLVIMVGQKYSVFF